MKTLKGYVRNKGRPEGCIAKGYLVEEDLSFCSMYLEDMDNRRTRPGRNTDQGVDNIVDGLPIFAGSGKPLGKKELGQFEGNVWKRAYHYVLFNYPEVKPFIDEYFLELRRGNPRKTNMELEQLQKQHFGNWFNERVNVMYSTDPSSMSEDMRFLALGPEKWGRCYKKYVVNGFRFRTKAVDTTGPQQNSGVFVTEQTSSYSSRRDRNLANGNVDYYGVLTDVIELRYHGNNRKVVLFECDWVDGKAFEIDAFGFTLVNLNRTLNNDDNYIIASQALQVIILT